jgi:hypothetical protein
MTEPHSRTMKITGIILPLDGGGLRWGCTWYVPPSPPPSPARGEGDNRVIFEAIEKKGGKQCEQVIFMKLPN